jgi:hypothetical protein
MCGVLNLAVETPDGFELPSNDEFLSYVKKVDPEVKIVACSDDSLEIGPSAGPSSQTPTQHEQLRNQGIGTPQVTNYVDSDSTVD